jgi:hypothetical protein
MALSDVFLNGRLKSYRITRAGSWRLRLKTKSGISCVAYALSLCSFPRFSFSISVCQRTVLDDLDKDAENVRAAPQQKNQVSSIFSPSPLRILTMAIIQSCRYHRSGVFQRLSTSSDRRRSGRSTRDQRVHCGRARPWPPSIKLVNHRRVRSRRRHVLYLHPRDAKGRV